MTIMNVNRGNFTPPTSQSALVLRNGQIVQGEIVKIYPQNKAEMKIGAHRFIAEINTSLTVGKKYFFQVHETANQIVQLRVIGDSFNQNMELNITQLLDKLGLKVNRQNVQLLQALLHDKLFFNREQLSQAFTILESAPNRQIAFSILAEMFAKRLPITENIFNALYAVRNNELTTSIQQLIADLTENPQKNNVQRQLESLLVQLVSRQDHANVSLQDRVGNQVHKNEFMSMLTQQSNQFSTSDKVSLTREKIHTLFSQLFYSHAKNNTISLESLVHDTAKLLNESNALTTYALEILQRFSSQLNTQNLSNQQFTVLQQLVQKNIMPLLPESMQQYVRSIIEQNTPANQTNVSQLLQLLSNNATYTLMSTTSKAFQHPTSHFHIATKTQLLATIQQFIQTMGMQDEQQIRLHLEQMIANQLEQPLQHQSIKSLLLQMMQDGNQFQQSKLVPFIHLVHGLQLQSVYESQNMIQATLQLPGEKFNLPKDLYFQFEGKKMPDGKLDPNHCRVLFVLHLQHMEETVIDMFVQKRIISLTIYNDHTEKTEQHVKSLVDMLTTQLDSLDFKLSTIQWKPFKEHEHQQVKSERIEDHESQGTERFDFRI